MGTPAQALPKRQTDSGLREAAPEAARTAALPWPNDLLELFSLRMASHGMSISRVGMRSDVRYALLQLRYAQDMDDATLALFADQLFRWFEAFQSGVSGRTQ